jgi:3-mercaptopyruvate sulfurtransferase SseA
MGKEDKEDKLVIIDCRYPFEYLGKNSNLTKTGGHIKGAVNLSNPRDIQMLLF